MVLANASSVSLAIPFLGLVNEELFCLQVYNEEDFSSRGDKRVTKYVDHCPCCSLELRKIINAAKADDSADQAAGPSKAAAGSSVSWQ